MRTAEKMATTRTAKQNLKNSVVVLSVLVLVVFSIIMLVVFVLTFVFACQLTPSSPVFLLPHLVLFISADFFLTSSSPLSSVTFVACLPFLLVVCSLSSPPPLIACCLVVFLPQNSGGNVQRCETANTKPQKKAQRAMKDKQKVTSKRDKGLENTQERRDKQIYYWAASESARVVAGPVTGSGGRFGHVIDKIFCRG